MNRRDILSKTLRNTKYTLALGASAAIASLFYEQFFVYKHMLLTGATIDLGAFMASHVKNFLFRRRPNIVQLVGSERYVKALIDRIREDHPEYSGKYRIKPAEVSLTGKSAFEGGFFDVFDIYFDSHPKKPVRVLYKESHDEENLEGMSPEEREFVVKVRDGANYVEALHELAAREGRKLDCIPKPIRPKDRELRAYLEKGDLGELFYWVEGKSLESRIDSTDPLFIPDDSVVSDVRRALDQTQIIYELTAGIEDRIEEDDPVMELLPTRRFDAHHRLIHRVTKLYGSNKFSDALEKRVERFDGIPLVCLHGDFSHHNIKQDEESTYAFDLDFGNFGIAYEDFLKFCLKTGVFIHPNYQELREQAIGRSMELQPGLQRFHFDLIDYEQQFYYFLGALDTLKKVSDDNEREKLMITSKALLDGSTESLRLYAQASGDNELLELHNGFCKQLNEFEELSSMEPIQANLAYLHDAERNYKSGNAVEVAESNKKGIQRFMQEMRLLKDRITYLKVAVPATLTLLSGYVLYDIHNFKQKYGLSDEPFREMNVALTALLALNLIRTVTNYMGIDILEPITNRINSGCNYAANYLRNIAHKPEQ